MDVICALEGHPGGNKKDDQMRFQIIDAWDLANDKFYEDSLKQDPRPSIAGPSSLKFVPRYDPTSDSWRIKAIAEEDTPSETLTIAPYSLKSASSEAALKLKDSAVDLGQDSKDFGNLEEKDEDRKIVHNPVRLLYSPTNPHATIQYQ